MIDWFLEKWINIKFRVKLGQNASDTCAVFSNAYVGEAMKKPGVFEWHKWFKEGYDNMEGERSGHPSSHRTIQNVENVQNLVHSEAHYVYSEAVCRKSSELQPYDWILHHENAPTNKALSIKQFLGQTSITEKEHPPYFPDVGLNNI
jgi:hypothetical protein